MAWHSAILGDLPDYNPPNIVRKADLVKASIQAQLHEAVDCEDIEEITRLTRELDHVITYPDRY